MTTGGNGGGGDSGLGNVIHSGLFDGNIQSGSPAADAGAPTGSIAGNAASGVASLLPNIQAWFDEWIAKNCNAINQICNTVFYASIAGWGVIFLGYGLYLLAKDLPGPAQGVADLIDLPVGALKLGAKVAGTVGKVAAL